LNLEIPNSTFTDITYLFNSDYIFQSGAGLTSIGSFTVTEASNQLISNLV